MANNRMWLRIKNQPEKEILLAKYYPVTGWYIYHTEEKLNKWFNKFLNSEDVPNQDWVVGQWGRVDLELVFETDQKELDEIREELKSFSQQSDNQPNDST